jgi:hypothetical protein
MVFSFFWSFAPHFQIKLSIHASNCNSRFVSMSELELFLLTGDLIANFNTVDFVKILETNQKLHIQIVANFNTVEFVKILEKNQELHIQIVAVTLKVVSCRTMSKKKK